MTTSAEVAGTHPRETFADGIMFCVACGWNLDKTDVMAIRNAIHAVRLFESGHAVPQRALVPHSTLPQPWREEYLRVAGSFGGGVPSIADLVKLLPDIAAHVPPEDSTRGPKAEEEEWRVDFRDDRKKRVKGVH